MSAKVDAFHARVYFLVRRMIDEGRYTKAKRVLDTMNQWELAIIKIRFLAAVAEITTKE